MNFVQNIEHLTFKFLARSQAKVPRTITSQAKYREKMQRKSDFLSLNGNDNINLHFSLGTYESQSQNYNLLLCYTFPLPFSSSSSSTDL